MKTTFLFIVVLCAFGRKSIAKQINVPGMKI